MSPAPLKRHASLIPLSRDHYGGLVQARRLRLAAERNAAERLTALRELLDEWNTQMASHFEDEERLLLPLLKESRLTKRLLRDHSDIRQAISRATRWCRVQSPPEPSWMRDLAQLLHDHIRWEERELFPAVEQIASPDQLRELTAETTRIEQSRPRWSNAAENAQVSRPRPMPR
jgi:hemerythrin-like domain-containing protein